MKRIAFRGYGPAYECPGCETQVVIKDGKVHHTGSGEWPTDCLLENEMLGDV